jgi:transcriptional regulator with XRE-family HTH domain
VTGPTTGERVALYRRQRGMSQRDLAAELRRSESWVSQVERNVQPVERLNVLQALAAALGVTVRDLRPEALSDEDGPETRVNDLDGLRMALSGHPAVGDLFGASATAETGDVVVLSGRVDHAWDLAHASRFAELSETLTALLPELERAVRQSPRKLLPALHKLRASAYQAASATFARQDEADASWVAADRAIAAAEFGGDPLGVVAGHFRLAHAFIRLRRLDQAERVAASALAALGPVVAGDEVTPEALSLCGAMHLVQAVIASHEGNRAAARGHLDDATAVAARVGEGRNDFGTEFGPTNVQLHRVAVAVELGDAGEALDVAAAVDASHLSSERQARFLIDVARAHAQRRHVGEATAALEHAHRLAPEHVLAHHHARATLEDLISQAGRRPPAALAELARRAGVTH